MPVAIIEKEMDVHRPVVRIQEKPAGPPPSATGLQSSVLWILLLVAALFFAVVAPRLRRRRPSSSEDRPGTFGDAGATARDELERLLGEIQDLSREHIAKLDTKIRMLNQLLIECDQKKKELEALLGRAVTTGMSKLEAPPPARPANPLHDQVYSLQDSGKTVFDICSATGLEKGEVDLILGLRKMPGKM
jgi:hypothetical protein